jgi:DNA-binding HxlR family transcriptional regulator
MKKRSDCPINFSLETWWDKWSLLIVRDLVFKKECTYGDFLKSEEKIATNILVTRLKMLEENWIIIKKEFPNNKVKSLYRLTQKGIDLVPILIEMNLWAEKYHDIVDENMKIVLKEIKKDKDWFIKDTMNRLK